MDSYPDVDENAKGISPWFRAGLVGTYHKGALIGLEWTTLTEDTVGEWRLTDYKNGEKGDIRVMLIGYVPFEKSRVLTGVGMSITDFHICIAILTHTGGSHTRRLHTVKKGSWTV